MTFLFEKKKLFSSAMLSFWSASSCLLQVTGGDRTALPSPQMILNFSMRGDQCNAETPRL